MIKRDNELEGVEGDLTMRGSIKVLKKNRGIMEKNKHKSKKTYILSTQEENCSY